MQFRDFNTGGKKRFVSLKNPGDKVTGVFKGEIIDYYAHFVKADMRWKKCAGRTGCPLCNKGEKASFRFAVNLIVKEEGSYVSKLFEQGRRVYEMLKTLNQEVGLEKQVVTITRAGSGQQTNYMVLPVAQVTPEMATAVAGVALQPLSAPPVVDLKPAAEVGEAYDSEFDREG